MKEGWMTPGGHIDREGNHVAEIILQNIPLGASLTTIESAPGTIVEVEQWRMAVMKLLKQAKLISYESDEQVLVKQLAREQGHVRDRFATACALLNMLVSQEMPTEEEKAKIINFTAQKRDLSEIDSAIGTVIRYLEDL